MRPRVAAIEASLLRAYDPKYENAAAIDRLDTVCCKSKIFDSPIGAFRPTRSTTGDSST